MRLCVPNFYSKFHCLADKCSDTCCCGWEIEIDKHTETLYKNVSGRIKKKLKANIENGQFKLLPKDRCPFLNSSNLCEIQKNLGENFLCDICREHPRFHEWFGDYKESGLGLCCEEAVRLLLNEPSLEFLYSNCDEPNYALDKESLFLKDEIFKQRKILFEILKNSSIPFSNRLLNALTQTELLQQQILPEFSEQNALQEMNPEILLSHFTQILLSTESFGNAWNEAVLRIKNKPVSEILNSTNFSFSQAECEKIIQYFLFRYFTKSIYDNLCLEKFKFAIFFMIILQSFAKELALDLSNSVKINSVKLLAKQLEYSEENMNLLFYHFNNDALFSKKSFEILITKFFNF